MYKIEINLKQYFTLNKSIHWKDVLDKSQPEVFTLLDSNDGNFIFSWNKESELIQNNFDKLKLKSFENKNKGKYIFGYIGYDATSSYYYSQPVKSNSNDILPESIFYVPEHVIIKKNNHYLYYGYEKNLIKIVNIEKSEIKIESNQNHVSNLESITFKNRYLENVSSIKKLIQNGDIYELNYCINFSKENIQLNVIDSFFNLKKNTQAPFSGILKYNNHYIISASPERFFNKHKDFTISQPIKGTAARGANDAEDKRIKLSLERDVKERAENIMIVDLVRNDFSRFSHKKSVTVTELCELYTFKNIHQLISTISSKIDQNITFQELLHYIFPMGSMTGAPKKNAIKYINEFEDFKRNSYSGALGFINPNNNMDFNVIIRSVAYNSNKGILSIGVGGAITHKSLPYSEYLECFIKLNSIKNSLVSS